MKKNISSLFLLQSLVMLSFAQQHKNSLAKEDIKGKVRSVAQTALHRYKTNGVFGKWEAMDSTVASFDTKGNQFEKKYYKADRSFYYTYISKYDQQQQNIENSSNDLNGNILGKTTYKYNSQHDLIEITEYGKDGAIRNTTSYSYADANNREEKNYGADGLLSSTWVRKFDSKGYETDYTHRSFKVNYSTRREKKYDSKGNKTEENMYLPAETFFMKYIYGYDVAGNCIAMHKYDAKGTLKDSNTYQYEFDKQLNWTKKTELDENGQPFHVEQRTISYY